MFNILGEKRLKEINGRIMFLLDQERNIEIRYSSSSYFAIPKESFLIPLSQERKLLEEEKRHILETRESFKQKVLWNVIAPVIVSFVTSLTTVFFFKENSGQQITSNVEFQRLDPMTSEIEQNLLVETME